MEIFALIGAFLGAIATTIGAMGLLYAFGVLS